MEQNVTYRKQVRNIRHISEIFAFWKLAINSWHYSFNICKQL